MNLSGEQLQLKYIPLEQVVLWDDNPKEHDIGALIASIEKYGYVDPAKFDPNLNGGTGGLVYGNGRSQCVQMLRDDPDKDIVPRGVCTDGDGNWHLPVLFGVDAESEAVARALAIDHNNLTMSKGLSLWEISKVWDRNGFAILLQELKNEKIEFASMTSDGIDSFLSVVFNDGVNVDDLYTGMPEFENDNQVHRRIIVSFESNDAVQEFAQLLGQKITDKTKSMWFPKKEKEKIADYGYIEE